MIDMSDTTVESLTLEYFPAEGSREWLHSFPGHSITLIGPWTGT